MKRKYFFTTLFLIFFFSANLFAMDISVGGMVWYAWWNPHTEDAMRGENNDFTKTGSFSEAYNDTFKCDPEFIAGPFIGLKFLDHWNLGLVCLASTEYKLHGTYDVNLISAPANVNHVDFVAEGNRYDFDSTLSYSVNRYLKIFAGYKYMMYDVTGSYIATGINPVSLDLDWAMRMYGPGVGITATFPLISNFFLPVSISILQMNSERNMKLTFMTTGTQYADDTEKSSFWGYSCAPGIGYYSETLGMSFIINGRYQYMKNEDDKRDEFYGISISAIHII